MSVLRVYDPSECYSTGLPMDWKRCRNCAGRGVIAEVSRVAGERGRRVTCEICGGHGSLKAAALAERTRERDGVTVADMPIGPEPYRARVFAERHPVRCEGCGHPMSDGTWESDQPYFGASASLDMAAELLRDGVDPSTWGDGNCIHWSPCDEGCRHLANVGDVRTRGDDHSPGYPHGWAALTRAADADVTLGQMVEAWPGKEFEASWREVGARTLSWPHDLRPEKLAVLCLRCWTAR